MDRIEHKDQIPRSAVFAFVRGLGHDPSRVQSVEIRPYQITVHQIHIGGRRLSSVHEVDHDA